MIDFKRQTYSNQVAAFVRTQIRKGELLPGAPVKEMHLAARLGISRAPIREALEGLVQEGLLTSEPQKGKSVRRFTAKELQDSYLVGGILEGAGVAQSLPRWTAADDMMLKRALRDIEEESSRAESLLSLSDLDDRFHAILCMHCDNKRLLEMVHLSCSTISKCWGYVHWLGLFTPREFLERHTEVARSVMTRDPELVERVLRAHYMETGRRMSAFGDPA